MIHTWQQDQYTSTYDSCKKETIKIIKEAIDNLESLNRTARENKNLNIVDLLRASNHNCYVIREIESLIDETTT